MRYKTFGVFGIISLLVLVFSFFVSGFPIAGVVLGLIYIVTFLIFSFGFIKLGREYNKTLLSVMAWITVVIFVIFLLLSLAGLVTDSVNLLTGNAVNETINLSGEEGISEAGLLGLVLMFIQLFLLLFILIVIAVAAYSVLFGIGLLSLRDEVKYAKAAGILNIVAGATYIIFIGFLVKFAAIILEIIMFFNLEEKQ